MFRGVGEGKKVWEARGKDAVRQRRTETTRGERKREAGECLLVTSGVIIFLASLSILWAPFVNFRAVTQVVACSECVNHRHLSLRTIHDLPAAHPVTQHGRNQARSLLPSSSSSNKPPRTNMTFVTGIIFCGAMTKSNLVFQSDDCHIVTENGRISVLNFE